MQANKNIEGNSLSDSPFVLVENTTQRDQNDRSCAQGLSWDFEIETPRKTLSLTLIANDDDAYLSDLVPVTHQLCDIINNLAIENESENGEEISCQKGCASCCSYMVSISSAEAFYLQKHILALPAEKRRSILHSFMRAARKIAAHKVPPVFESDASESECLKTISSWYQKMGIKCPFIKDNACSQYLARPLVCREHMVTSPARNCSPSLRMLTNIIQLPISTAETLMRISNKAESICDEAIVLPMALVWCNSNAERGEIKYQTTLLAELLIEAVSAKAPAMP